MGGIAAITAANGWLMAFLGMSVVFAGLASLSLILSCFSRVIAWQNAQSPQPMVPWLKSLFGRRGKKALASPAPGEILNDGEIEDMEETLQALSASLGNPFKLPRLLELAEGYGLPRSHAYINRLILEGRVVGSPDGLFRWEPRKDEPMAFSDLTEFW
jgi:Na+-transporting methylmalonyl-CoA/oxaloacetate decarboxylase gamma subunit